MKRILVILHQKRSRPRRVGRVLRERGFELDIRRPCDGDALPETMEEHAAAVIFGGPLGVYDCDAHPHLRRELVWIGVALASGKPFFGICLGCQMLAYALGGRVWRHPEGRHEIGYFPIVPAADGGALFDRPFHAFQWHRDGFEMPRGGVLLARGEIFECQAFRYGANAYGVQFHPEVTPATMVRWTTFAHEQKVPDARPVAEILAHKDEYEPVVRHWLYRFVDLWLGEEVQSTFRPD